MRIARTITTVVAAAAAAAALASPASAEPAPPAPAVPAALVSTAGAIPEGAQPALAELAQTPQVQEIIATGQLPTTDVATLVEMFGQDPAAQRLLAQVLAGQAGTPAPPAEPAAPLRFPVVGAIKAAFDTDGGLRKYGQPLAAEADAPAGGKFQDFERGTIYWNPTVADGRAAGVVGAIKDAYRAEGGPQGRLGFPLMSELSIGGPTPDSVAGAYNDFQRGSIVWSPQNGAHVVSGAIKDQWVRGGGAFGVGYPLGPQQPGPDGSVTQEFSKGGTLRA